MTKTAIVTSALLLLISAVPVHAAPIITATQFETEGLTGFTINIDPDDLVYDTAEVTFTPLVANTFNQVGAPNTPKLTAGTGADTAFLLNLIVLPASPVGLDDTTDRLFGVWSTEGSDNLSANPLDYADVVFTANGTGGLYEIAFADDGTEVGRVTGRFLVPEPASLMTMAAAFFVAIGMIARRRKLVA